MLATRPPARADLANGRRGAAVLLLGGAGGVAAAAALLALLARWPSVVRARGAGAAARPALAAAVALPMALAGAALFVARRPHQRLALRGAVALACVGSGAAWVVWGLLMQHVLRAFDLAPGTAAAGAWDALFHGIGVVAAGLGTSLRSARGGEGPAT